MNKKARGDIGEAAAAEFLEQNGYTVLKRNKRYAGAEIDIIAHLPSRKETRSSAAKGRARVKLNAFFAYCGGKHRQSNMNLISGGTIVFCEVKSRESNDYGEAAEAVTPARAFRYVQAAKAFLQRHQRFKGDIRFDVVAVTLSPDGVYKVSEHIQNAFDANYAKRGGRRY
jgi:putative endonuclease